MKLTYNALGTFKIIQFTDLHLGPFPFNKNDKKTLLGIERTVVEHQPDLLVFTGDIIYSLAEHEAPNPKETFEQFINFVNGLNIAYTLTFGNHDAEQEEQVTREELRAIYKQQATGKIDNRHAVIIANRENFVIELYDSTGERVENIIYIIDSGDYSTTAHSYYAWILPEQIAWFKETAERYKRNDKVKRNLIFQHIPIPEYWLASQNISDGNFNEEFTLNGVHMQPCNQNFRSPNGVFSPEVNSGFFLEILLNNEIWGMFVGHDHDNSFDGLHKGIHLVYGQSTGYNTYGTEPKGARVIELNESKQSVRTYRVVF